MLGLTTTPNWRPGALLASSLLVMAIASFATHLAGPGEAEAGGEAAEHAAFMLPPLIGPLAALAILGFVRLVRRRTLGPAWFVLLPPIAFGLQEVTERLVNGQMAEPSILATGLVQVPFALLAYFLARILRAAVIRVARFLSAPRALPRLRVGRPMWLASLTSVVHVPAVVGTHRGRAPPSLR